MSSEILINSAIGETRFALMEQGRAVEIRLFRDHAPGRVGTICHGRITALSKAFQAAFVDLGEDLTGFLPLSSLPKRPGRKPKDLTSLLHEGQKIIVQVSADASPGKSIKLTGRVELTSPVLILHPFREGAFVSSQIRDPERRQQLKDFASHIDSGNIGFTLRPDAAALGNDDIEKAVIHLARHWKRAVENRAKAKIPFLLAQRPDSLSQILRDYADSHIDRIILDRPSALKSARDWTQEFAPHLTGRMMLHQERQPLFDHYGVEEELEQIFDKHIPLPSGAWITLEQTEAMVVADVNMGAARGSDHPAKQRLQVNLEATKKIFRQIRLRGISGLMVIDYINMSGKADISNLLTVVDNCILSDPVQIQRSSLSSFGLLELTRKGRHLALSRHMLTDTTPMATIETKALALLRQAEQDAATRPGIPMKISADKETTAWLKAQNALTDKFTRRTGSRLIIG